jgi:hypothetical protein
MSELLLFFQTFWQNSPDIPETLQGSLKKTDSLMFPNIHTILRLLLTLPITTCTCERSISVLGRIKTFNRTTMTDDRLSALCMICAYRHKQIDWEKMVNTFANQNPRRMVLQNILDDSKV